MRRVSVNPNLGGGESTLIRAESAQVRGALQKPDTLVVERISLSPTASVYELRAQLGTGGFVTVHRGYDPVLDCELALKVLRPHSRP